MLDSKQKKIAEIILTVSQQWLKQLRSAYACSNNFDYNNNNNDDGTDTTISENNCNAWEHAVTVESQRSTSPVKHKQLISKYVRLEMKPVKWRLRETIIRHFLTSFTSPERRENLFPFMKVKIFVCLVGKLGEQYGIYQNIMLPYIITQFITVL